MPAESYSAIRRHPALSYFALTFFISWLGALGVAAPHLLRHEPIPKFAGILTFPVMLLGPVVAGLLLTRICGGPPALRDLFSRMRRVGVSPGWYAALLLPPIVLFTVLYCLGTFVSPVFAHGAFLMGIFFGVPAGFFEEIGWMGFAFPKLSLAFGPRYAAVLLGLLWGLWHLPVIDFLGVASPHGRYLVPFFLAFVTAMTAMRVLIAWVYAQTGSILLCQLLHVSSTGALVIFSPPAVNAAQESLWYFVYGVALWMIVAVVLKSGGLPPKAVLRETNRSTIRKEE